MNLFNRFSAYTFVISRKGNACHIGGTILESANECDIHASLNGQPKQFNTVTATTADAQTVGNGITERQDSARCVGWTKLRQ